MEIRSDLREQCVILCIDLGEICVEFCTEGVHFHIDLLFDVNHLRIGHLKSGLQHIKALVE